jgi:hypothetical protein
MVLFEDVKSDGVRMTSEATVTEDMKGNNGSHDDDDELRVDESEGIYQTEEECYQIWITKIPSPSKEEHEKENNTESEKNEKAKEGEEVEEKQGASHCWEPEEIVDRATEAVRETSCTKG